MQPFRSAKSTADYQDRRIRFDPSPVRMRTVPPPDPRRSRSEFRRFSSVLPSTPTSLEAHRAVAGMSVEPPLNSAGNLRFELRRDSLRPLAKPKLAEPAKAGTCPSEGIRQTGAPRGCPRARQHRQERASGRDGDDGCRVRNTPARRRVRARVPAARRTAAATQHDRHAIEWHAAACFAENPSCDLDGFAAFARRGEQFHFADRLALWRRCRREEVVADPGETVGPILCGSGSSLNPLSP